MTDPQTDLDELIYIISHDLNAPLRHVKSFNKLLINKLGDKVGEEEQEYVDYIDSAIVKMQDMISALLQYSRLKSSETASEFDIELLVKEVCSDYQAQLEESEASFQISSLPKAFKGNEKQIRALISHLIDNAIKFRVENQPLKIHVTGEQLDDKLLLTVLDNGIGIPKHYHEKVFKLFVRLNSENYPGIGAGLTLARKIVELHNGTIAIEPSETGTRITVTLPQ